MKRASYRHAVELIALNDNEGSGDSVEEIAGYVTTQLMATLFDVEPDKLANDVARCRARNGLEVGESF